MHAFVILLLFVGVVMVMQGVYEEKLKDAERNVRVEYRFVPRTFYEEQLAEADLDGKFSSMFQKESPWFDRNVGGT